MQHCCLFNDRIEYYHNTTDAERQLRRRGTIQLTGVKGVQEGRHSFVLQSDVNNMEMRVVTQDDLEAWVGHIKQVIADMAKRKERASHPETSQAKHANMGTPCFGKGDSGFEAWPAGHPPMSDKTSVLALKFPTAPWPAPPNFMPELRKNLLALGFVRCRVRSISFKEGSVMAEVQGSKEQIKDFQEAHVANPSMFGVMGYTLSEMTLVIESGKEVNKRVEVDLDAPLHSAILGIQHGGCLSNKFFVLYRDRLDYFEDKKDAVSGVRPLGRIALAEVREYEAYGSGFILKLLGRSIGLHVPADDDPKLWTTFLSQALSNNIAPDAKTRRESWGMGRFKTATAKAKAGSKPKRQALSQRGPRDREERAITPRAITPRRDAGGARDVTPNRSINTSTTPFSARGSPSSAISAVSPGSNSFTSDMADNRLLWVCTREETRRESNGGLWTHRDIARKINTKQSTIVQQQPEVSDKLTGDRTHRALSVRKGTNVNENTTTRISERPSGISLLTSRSTPDITTKVNDPNRCFKIRVGPDRMEVKGKVNEIGKASTGWLRKGPSDSCEGLADKVGRFDNSRSAPSLNGEVRTAGVSSDSVRRPLS